MFVYVEYRPSLKTAVVEHKRVRCSPTESFDPKDVNDFRRSRTYYVRSCHKDRLYEAIRIIHMTETLEEMAMFRAARPRRLVDAERDDCEMNGAWTPACRDQEHIEEQERQQQIEDALHEYGVGPLPSTALADLQRKLQAVTDEVDRLRRQGQCSCIGAVSRREDVVPRSTYTQLKRKYESLLQKFRQLEARNANLEVAERSTLAHSEGSPERAVTVGDHTVEPPSGDHTEMVATGQALNGTTPKEDDISLEFDVASEDEPESADAGNMDQQETERRPIACAYAGNGIKAPKVGSARQDGKIYAGRDVWVNKRDWDTLFSCPTDVRFCSLAASLFWTTKELSDRSVTGLASRRLTVHGTFPEARPPLTPEKLEAVKGLFRIYVGKDALASRRLSAVRKHLSNKICDIRRAGRDRRTKKI